MQRDRNIPDIERDDISLWIDIISRQLELCAIGFIGILSLFGLLFMYYNFGMASTIVKICFYIWGFIQIFEYIRYNWKKYIQSIKQFAIFAPFGKPSIDDKSD